MRFRITAIFVITASVLEYLGASTMVHGLSSPSPQPLPSSSSATNRELPLSAASIARQAAISITNAMSDAGNADCINKQTIRLPLSESMYGNKEEGFVADRAIGWQGGPQETSRYLIPLATEVLQEVSTRQRKRRAEADGDEDDKDDSEDGFVSTGGLVSKISQQTLLDFDGSTLLTSEHPAGPIYDVQALLQPNTDDYYSKTIQAIEEGFSDTPNKPQRLFLLINPAWKNKDSWGFFGADKAQKQILNRYELTYCVDQFVVRGIKLSLLKEYGQDWAVFLTPMPYEKDVMDKAGGEYSNVQAKLIGTFPNRPEYKELDTLLLQKLKEEGGQSR